MAPQALTPHNPWRCDVPNAYQSEERLNHKYKTMVLLLILQDNPLSHIRTIPLLLISRPDDGPPPSIPHSRSRHVRF